MKTPELESLIILKELTDIGVALSKEKDPSRLLEMILKKARELTNADGATLYECTDAQELKFSIVFNESLGIHLGGTSGKDITFPPLSMYDANGHPNENMVATWVATSQLSVNIPDAYKEKKFDFSGTYAFDKKLGYHSQSFLTVPLTNHLDEMIGVLQIINALDKKTKKIVPFSEAQQKIIESLASQAAVTITNQSLIEAQKQLFHALIQLIATAIDEKSPYTAGHCRRVPIITRLIADAACRVDKGPLKTFNMTEDEKYEVEVAAWLHDCGKITTPVHVVDKATKLETIYDSIHLVDTRFEVLKRDAMIAHLQRQLSDKEANSNDEKLLQEQLKRYDEDRNFIRECNIGKEFISEEHIQRIAAIANQTWQAASGEVESFLSSAEVQNLSISRGTLSTAEREIINNHVKISQKMLESLPYPKTLKRVPEFAGSHHEKMDGTGYPRGLTRDKMTVQARIIAIADVFEALSASDRPYKKAMPLSQCLKILGEMKLSGHIDPDLFDVFIHEKVYLDYAKAYLDPKNIDDINLALIPGYSPL